MYGHIRRRSQFGRTIPILLASTLYLGLVIVDATRFFPIALTPPVVSWMRDGLSSLVALAFLTVGSLVWFYSRKRQEAALLFCFCIAIMTSFAVQTGAVANDPLLSAIGDGSASLALTPFFALLLIFPHDFLSKKAGPHGDELGEHFMRWLLYGYLGLLILLSLSTTLHSVLSHLHARLLPNWLNTIDYTYFALVLIGIVAIAILSYVRATSVRDRQQLRFFLGGSIVAFAPLLVLTIFPLAINKPQLAVDGQISTLTLTLLPLAIGYSLLRYQLLVFDSYIRHTATRIVGGLGLALLCYLVVMLSNLAPVSTLLQLVIAVCAMALLVPILWRQSQALSERLFFPEIRYYRQLVEREAGSLVAGASEAFDLVHATDLLVQAAREVFATREVWLLVLDEDTGCYQLPPSSTPYLAIEASPHQLYHYLSGVLIHKTVEWIPASESLIAYLSQAKRPVLLSEAIKGVREGITSPSRYLTPTTPLDSCDPLLVPIRVRGKLIGLLVLGRRGALEQYAGPDLEPAALIAARYAPILETARLYAMQGQHVAILNTLYSASLLQKAHFKDIEQLGKAYTRIAAEATATRVTLWLYDEQTHALRHADEAGSGPVLTAEPYLEPVEQSDILFAHFYGDSREQQGPAGAEESPHLFPSSPFAFAWLPLRSDERLLGVLTLTYPRPHQFSHEERRVLAMFASQCAESLIIAQFTLELQVANEKLKELDRLKDQFILVASHELRTPLTAVQGYLELLGEFGERLDLQARDGFIKKAVRGCGELELLLGNILDAGRLPYDAASIKREPVVLAQAVGHVLEILEAIIDRERRHIQVHVPPSLQVMADENRLRQVILNLMSNALKYSPTGSSLDVEATTRAQHITLSIRDYGLGIPSEEQYRLFERFVRLERDMNSPVRGTGLGLAISKQLIVAMGGHIWVESSGIEGEGSTFCFMLAIAPVPLTEEKVGEAISSNESSKKT